MSNRKVRHSVPIGIRRLATVAAAWLCAVGGAECWQRYGAPLTHTKVSRLPNDLRGRIEMLVARTHLVPAKQFQFLDILQLTSPASFGVSQWQVGDWSSYHVFRDGHADSLTVRVIRSCVAEDAYFRETGVDFFQQQWIQIANGSKFRDHYEDLFRLASPEVTEISIRTPEFQWSQGYFPIVSFSPHYTYSSYHLSRRIIGAEENVMTQGTASSVLEVRNQAEDTVATIWVSSKVSPFGIVKYQSDWETVELLDKGNCLPSFPEDKNQLALVSGQSCFCYGCASCHDKATGGGPLHATPR